MKHHFLCINCSGSVDKALGLRSKGCLFETHWRHCVVTLSKTLYPLLSTVQPTKTGNHPEMVRNFTVFHCNKNKSILIMKSKVPIFSLKSKQPIEYLVCLYSETCLK